MGRRRKAKGSLACNLGIRPGNGGPKTGIVPPALDANLTTRKTRETRHSLYVCHTMAKKRPIRVHNLLILRNKHQNIWMTKCYH
jgi:hypothetical protein